MKNIKKFIALLIAAVLCVGYPVGITEAVDWCPGSKHSLGLKPNETQTFTSTHNIYRNIYVDGVQVYSICTVKTTITYQVVGCKKCVYEQKTQIQRFAVHSLASDPDHK